MDCGFQSLRIVVPCCRAGSSANCGPFSGSAADFSRQQALCVSRSQVFSISGRTADGCLHSAVVLFLRGESARYILVGSWNWVPRSRRKAARGSGDLSEQLSGYQILDFPVNRMSSDILLSVVIPVYNECAAIGNVWCQLRDALSAIDGKVEVIVIDDGSTDGTWDAVIGFREEAAGVPLVRGLRFGRNFGKEAAMLAGLRLARGQAVVVMDGDLQHPPEMVPAMVELWRKGEVDIVEAVKRKRQPESGAERLAASVFYRLFHLSSGMDLRKATDFKLLDRRVVDQYVQFPEVGRFFRGLTAWLGVHQVGIEFDPPARRHGVRSWSLSRLFGMARIYIISFSSLPLRLVTWFGVIGLLFSFVLMLQTLWYHGTGAAEAGFPTVILLILGMGSMVLTGIGLIGEYIAEIYKEVKHRPPYVIVERLPDEESS